MAKQGAEKGQDILPLLEAKDYPLPIYILDGEEAYFVDKVCERMLERIIPEADRPMSQFLFYGPDMRMQALIAQARQFSIFGGRQLILVRDADQISDFYREEGATLLGAYLEDPQPGTCLVLAIRGKNVDGVRQTGRRIYKTSYLFRSHPLNERQMVGFIERELKARGIDYDRYAPQAIEQLVGNDLSLLTTEIDKLALSIPPKGMLSAELVGQIVGESREFTVFQLQDALFRGDMARALRICQHFASHTKEHPAIKEISVLSAGFWRLLMVYQLTREDDASRVLGVSPYRVRDYEQAAQYYRIDTAAAFLHLLSECDGLAKGLDARGGTVQMDADELWKHFMIGAMGIRDRVCA